MRDYGLVTGSLCWITQYYMYTIAITSLHPFRPRRCLTIKDPQSANKSNTSLDKWVELRALQWRDGYVTACTIVTIIALYLSQDKCNSILVRAIVLWWCYIRFIDISVVFIRLSIFGNIRNDRNIEHLIPERKSRMHTLLVMGVVEIILLYAAMYNTLALFGFSVWEQYAPSMFSAIQKSVGVTAAVSLDGLIQEPLSTGLVCTQILFSLLIALTLVSEVASGRAQERNSAKSTAPPVEVCDPLQSLLEWFSVVVGYVFVFYVILLLSIYCPPASSP